MTYPGGLRQEEAPSMPCRSEAAASLALRTMVPALLLKFHAGAGERLAAARSGTLSISPADTLEGIVDPLLGDPVDLQRAPPVSVD